MNVVVVQVQESAGISVDDGLARASFSAIAVASGAAAFASNRDADLVLLDLDSDLSCADGLEICRMIRTHSEIPIIAFTRQGAELDGRLGIGSSLGSYVETPVAF